jgi:hypothetical protein
MRAREAEIALTLKLICIYHGIFLIREDTMDGFEEIFTKKGVPRIGTLVRCRKNNSLWRVMEQEVLRRVEPDPDSRELQVVPTFYLSFWRIKTGVPPGSAKCWDIFIPSTTTLLRAIVRSPLTTEPRGVVSAGHGHPGERLP